MRMILLGTVGFVLYFVYDINSIKMKNTILQQFFGVGSLCLVIATVGTMINLCDFGRLKKPIGMFCAVASIFFLLVLIYTLFFALPFDQTYLKENKERLACTEGMYALCRHPGILWFTALYLCLWGIVGFSWRGIYFLLMILWNVLYVIFQDLWIFPLTFTNYAEYKRTTPFLIPDRDSIYTCISTWNGWNRGER